MSRYDELDRLDDDAQDDYDRFGYPDLPWVAAEQEWRDERDAFERESRYYDAPVERRVPFRVTDTDALMNDLQLMAAGMSQPSIRDDLRDAA